MRRTLYALFLALLVGLAAPSAAKADPIEFTLQGVNDPSLSASVLMTYNASLGQLSLDITNTSASYDPRLTGFAFNLPLQVLGISSFSSSLGGWSYSYDRNDIDTPGQFGLYDAAGLTGPNFNGGSPNLGIAIGSSASFLFRFSGLFLNTLNEDSFASLTSYDAVGGPNESEQSFIARFQRVGSNGNGSDVAIPTQVNRVPEPSSLLLSGIGFLGLAMRRRLSPRKS